LKAALGDTPDDTLWDQVYRAVRPVEEEPQCLSRSPHKFQVFIIDITLTYSDSVAHSELRALREGLEATFKDPHNAFPLLQRFIKECWLDFKKRSDKYLAPYTSLVQSSGYGKTRLAVEWTRRFPGESAYICLRLNHESGYPPGTPLAQKLLQQALDASPEHPLIVERLRKVLCAIRVVFSSISDKEKNLWDAEKSSPLWDKVDQTVQNMTDVPQQCSDQNMFVLFLDEANNLANLSERQEFKGKDAWMPFRLFRRALDSSGVFCVMLGTNSKLTNFHPTRDHDDSARNLDKELFSPFIVSGFTDINVESPKLEQDAPLSEVFRLGRPLWDLYIGKEPGSLAPVVSLARGKLLRGRREPACSDAERVAIACVRLSLDVGIFTELAHDLVAGHMATLLAVDSPRRYLLLSYASEPVLGEAAAQLWNSVTNGDRYWQKEILPALVRLSQHNTVSIGEKGELVARLLLLLAVDKANPASQVASEPENGPYYSQPVPLIKFLAELANVARDGDDGRSADLETGLLKNATIRLTHFIALRTTPTMRTLQLLWSRCAGGAMPTGHVGADIIIPLQLSDRTLSCILVQVKNQVSTANFVLAASDRLLPDNVFSDSDLAALPVIVRILMQLGSTREEEAKFLQGSTSQHNLRHRRSADRKHLDPLVLYGLSGSVYRCLEDLPSTAMTHLKMLARPPYNLDSWTQPRYEWKTKLAKAGLPVVYDEAAQETGDVDMEDAAQVGGSPGVHPQDEHSESEVAVAPSGRGTGRGTGRGAGRGTGRGRRRRRKRA
jgi:hypothetical protein